MNGCASCRFFVAAIDHTGEKFAGLSDEAPHDTCRIRERGGSCHRYAPQPLGGGSGSGWADWEWPAVSPNDHCGEWKPREETP